jgi:hypothetical protein
VSGAQVVDQQHQAGKVAILWSVTAVSGTTPTVNHVLDWSVDNGITWCRDLQFAPPELTAAGNGTGCVDVKGTSFRVSIVIGGTTPSVTSSVQSAVF